MSDSKVEKEAFSPTAFYPRRSKIVGSFWLAVLLGLPFWYLTTYTYRASLPHEAIEEWVEWKRGEPAFPIHVTLHVGGVQGSDIQLGVLSRQVSTSVETLVEVEKEHEGTASTASPRIDFDLNCRALIYDYENVNVESAIKEMGKPGAYDVYILPSSKEEEVAIVGSGRGMLLRVGEYKQEKIAQHVTSLLFHLLTREIKALRSTGVEHGTMQWAPEYQLVLSLLVEDPRDRVVEWDIPSAMSDWLSPFIQHVSRISTFSVTTQVLNYASPPIQPSFQSPSLVIAEGAKEDDIHAEGAGHFFYNVAQLPSFIDTTHWQLASTVSLAPALHFLTFIPSALHTPLHLHDEQGERAETDAFLIPQWGGIAVLNLPWEVEGGKVKLSSENMSSTMAIFHSQLRSLLGVRTILPGSLEAAGLPVRVEGAGEVGVTGWEEDALLRLRMLQTMERAVGTLSSLSRSVQSLEHMPVKEEIRERVKEALFLVQKSCEQSKQGDLVGSFQSASEAFTVSEKAFFDKDMVAMLYFPDEHKYAIYMPLFVPIAVPLGIALVQVWKGWRATVVAKPKSD